MKLDFLTPAANKPKPPQNPQPLFSPEPVESVTLTPAPCAPGPTSEEGGITTYCRLDDKRGVLSIMDAEQDVPRIFGEVDPKQLTAGTFQLGQPILIF